MMRYPSSPLVPALSSPPQAEMELTDKSNGRPGHLVKKIFGLT